ncbi:MAG TPA: hypothetical protein DIW54_11445, partial [Chitinophagaceae bacterium]|nr:hypothetical protein [Chitinophagaceae bacterium]
MDAWHVANGYIRTPELSTMRKLVLICFTLGLLTQANAQKKKAEINPAEKMKTAASTSLDAAYPRYKDIALKIWDFAEVGYKEVK